MCASSLSSAPENANRLIFESSPYLLQHAYNPVNWYPWGREALETAKREDKLLMISIGYAACHWCHVMARESFVEHKVAAVLNRSFISVKVDREERPDLDGYFMEVVTAMTGQGGWPLHIFLTPDLQPVYGGTYFPPEPRAGMLAFGQILESMAWVWSNKRAELRQESERRHDLYPLPGRLFSSTSPGQDVDFRPLATQQLAMRFDQQYGGFGMQPKFPQPLILSLFLRQSVGEQQAQWGAMVQWTLDQMAAGGVRDQLGGSFHRYSVDRGWQVPHFEIMLYDNALLARVFVEAFQRLGHTRFALLAREILDDLLLRFRLPDGTFASSLNAETVGQEGIYYTWTREEVVQILGAEAAQPVLEAFLDVHDGTVEGRSVLRFLDKEKPERLTEVWQSLAVGRQALLLARQQRPAPSRDDKVLTSWNALTISALAKAGAVLEEPRYLQAAQQALTSLWHTSQQADGWRHSRLGSKVGKEVFVDDYAFMIQALLDMYEADFQINHLERARAMVVVLLDRFQPDPGQPLQLTPKDHPLEIPVRSEWEDGVIPAGNSSALIALRRLAFLTQDDWMQQEAAAIAHNLGGVLAQSAVGSAELLAAWDFAPQQVMAIVVAGMAADDATQALLRVVRRRLLPGMILALVEPGRQMEVQTWPMLTGHPMQNGQPTAYLCQNFSCAAPVTEPAQLAALLDASFLHTHRL
ncbi:MAG: thioredoxin domain-containing protein [Magnetococcales bacterium]|nr:thioredoxin domain-containing protein [Magnetococcales bacterium]